MRIVNRLTLERLICLLLEISKNMTTRCRDTDEENGLSICDTHHYANALVNVADDLYTLQEALKNIAE